MTRLHVAVTGARPEPHAIVPVLQFGLRVEADAARSILLHAQIVLQPRRRRYSPEEADALRELFGDTAPGSEPQQLLWTHVTAVVPEFRGSIEVDLPVPCTYDLEVAASKYLHALRSGAIPVLMLFSGSVYTDGPRGLQITPVDRTVEASFGLPVSTWRDLIDLHYPDSGWIRLASGTIDRLRAVRAAQGLTSWDETVEKLLGARP